MHHPTLVLLLLGGFAGHAPAAPTVPQQPEAQAQEQELRATLQENDPVQTLVQAYDVAEDAWRQALHAADGVKAKRELRERHPAKEYWPRFLALADAGKGQALNWMIEHARVAGHTGEAQKEVVSGLYGRVFREHLGDVATLEGACELLQRDRRVVGEAPAVALVTGAFERAEAREAKALLALQAGRLLLRAKDEKSHAMAIEWLERSANEFGDTTYGASAADLVFEAKHLVVGAVAPDFGGTSIDGAELKLADQRGKIVVLDFFGFW